MDWQGEFDITRDYASGDVVAFGGSSFIASAAVSAGKASPPVTPWELMSFGGAALSAATWSASSEYRAGDFLEFPPASYLATGPIPANRPLPDRSDQNGGPWAVLLGGMPAHRWRGDWSKSEQYENHDVVTFANVPKEEAAIFVAIRTIPAGGAEPPANDGFVLAGPEIRLWGSHIWSLVLAVLSSATAIVSLALSLVGLGQKLASTIIDAAAAVRGALQAVQAAEATLRDHEGYARRIADANEQDASDLLQLAQTAEARSSTARGKAQRGAEAAQRRYERGETDMNRIQQGSTDFNGTRNSVARYQVKLGELSEKYVTYKAAAQSVAERLTKR